MKGRGRDGICDSQSVGQFVLVLRKTNYFSTYPVDDDGPTENVGETEDVGLLQTGTGLARQTESSQQFKSITMNFVISVIAVIHCIYDRNIALFVNFKLRYRNFLSEIPHVVACIDGSFMANYIINLYSL